MAPKQNRHARESEDGEKRAAEAAEKRAEAAEKRAAKAKAKADTEPAGLKLSDPAWEVRVSMCNQGPGLGQCCPAVLASARAAPQ